MSERNNNDSIEELAGQLKRKFNVKNWWGLLAREVKIIEIEAKISVYDVYSNSRYESVAHHAKFFKDQYERQLNTLKGAHTITESNPATIEEIKRMVDVLNMKLDLKNASFRDCCREIIDLRQKLEIYETRFCIIDGVIHSLLADKVLNKPVAIGHLEHAYHISKEKQLERLDENELLKISNDFWWPDKQHGSSFRVLGFIGYICERFGKSKGG